MKAVPRGQASALSRLLETFPAVLVFGPRQSGKSTLLRAALSGWRLAGARVNSESLLGEPVILDEVQRSPDLLVSASGARVWLRVLRAFRLAN